MTYVTGSYVVHYDDASGDYVLEPLPDAPGSPETAETEDGIPEWVNGPGERLARMVPGARVSVVTAGGPLREWWTGARVESVSRDRRTATLARTNRNGRTSRRTVTTDSFNVA